jgi:site-specific recombinase XerD
LIDEAVTAIREQQFKRATYELEYQDEWTNERGALFVNADGSILNPDSFSKRFSRYVKELGLTNIGLHGLRHTFATVALEAGVPLKVLSDMLGHSEITVTADIYQHVTVESKATAFEQVAGLIR